jgi:Zn-dependent oligopeptidase
MNILETQHHATKVLEQQLFQMRETLESISREKDEASKKYQNYVQQLDEGHTKLVIIMQIFHFIA